MKIKSHLSFSLALSPARKHAAVSRHVDACSLPNAGRHWIYTTHIVLNNEYPAVCVSIEQLNTLAIMATKESIIWHAAGAYLGSAIGLASENEWNISARKTAPITPRPCLQRPDTISFHYYFIMYPSIWAAVANSFLVRRGGKPKVPGHFPLANWISRPHPSKSTLSRRRLRLQINKIQTRWGCETIDGHAQCLHKLRKKNNLSCHNWVIFVFVLLYFGEQAKISITTFGWGHCFSNENRRSYSTWYSVSAKPVFCRLLLYLEPMPMKCPHLHQ